MTPSDIPDRIHGRPTQGDPTTGPRTYQALIQVDRDDQLDQLALLAGDAEIGLAVLGSDDGEHLDFVNVVDVDGREDGVYVFSEHADAERFADAVDHDRDEDAAVDVRRAFVAETPVNLGAAAERLIAAERGDVLEDLFGPALAEDVREGTALEVVLRKLREVGEGGSDVAVLVRRWIELDERTRSAEASAAGEVDAAGAFRPSRRRAYTVVGCRGRGGAPYVTTVRTSDGPEAALDLAHQDFEEDRCDEVDVELEIVAIFHGGPELVGFDSPEPGGAKGGASR
ncbi:MAG TPA: hypothetical protein VHA80_06660 [Solirubrobacterales bacterium]|nr:hypothetical protein [Solirubrobacterales bacterium]